MTFISRKIKDRISRVLNRGKSILLLGPRQTGKTTLMQQLDPDLYISLANSKTRFAFEKDPNRLSREVEALSLNRQSMPLIIIDEVQKIPILMDAIQDLIDSKQAQFILTGSSARKLRREGINLLPGRVISLRMDPLILEEVKEFSPDIRDFLLYGSLPEIWTEKFNINREEDLASYVTTYLEEEIRQEALVRKIHVFSRFLRLAALESGYISNFYNISKELGVSHTTISNYYEILVDCLVAERIEPLSQSRSRKRLVKSPKFLLYDLGVRRLAAGEGTDIPEKYMGNLFEQWVGLELIRLLHTQVERSSLMFWRDLAGPEVDWVVERHNQYIPIEVKWTENPTPSDAKHIKTFLEEYDNSSFGYVICRAPRRQKLADRILAIPWQEITVILEKEFGGKS